MNVSSVQPGGRAQVADRQHNAASTSGFLAMLRAMDRWWTVLLLLFGVTGVLGVPVLWLSRAYNVPMKLLISVIVTLYTAFLFWLVYLVWKFAYDSVWNSLN